ncbi:MAG: response regulator, partial [Caldithrix sp.]|nr:response regulator [Caldithrix sp.]
YTPEKLIDKYVQSKENVEVEIEGDETETNSSSVVKLVNKILIEAIESGASDIHIEPKEQGVSIRNRIDGTLRNVLSLPLSIHPKLMSRIKIISNLDIAENRKPQDGKAKITLDNNDIDLRVSLLPTSYGEKGVIRILDRRKAMLSFEKMGVRGNNLNLLKQCFDYKQGIVLVTGPTGSGKSTSLYAALNRIRSTTNNILTIEDPIEYMLDGINQVQVNKKAGVTFATALRSFLRQDPDVILVGEIRDTETANIAIQAALTGHLVLSTLHTNDTFNTITRLTDMGVDQQKVLDSMQGIVAQRLVRKLCDHCKSEIPAKDIDDRLAQMLKSLNLNPRVYESKGCEKCGYTGYKGRIGIYEILLLDDELRDLINSNAGMQKVRQAARKRGFHNLFEDAMSLVSEGITDYPEVLRVIQPSLQQTAAAQQETEVPVQEDDEILKVGPETGENEQKATITARPLTETNEDQTTTSHSVTKTENAKRDILVVEDYKLTRALINRLIEKKPEWTSREATNGRIALKAVEDKIPDLIILDIMMPEMDGYEFLQHLREKKEWQDIPVLVLTALKESDAEVKGFEMGADDFLNKPFKKEIFYAHLNRIFARQNSAPAVKVNNAAPVTEDSSDTEDTEFKLID